MVVLCNTDLEGTLKVATEIQREIANLAIPHETYISHIVIMSMGISSLIPTSDKLPDDLIALSDKALYEAKHQGRDRYEVASL